MNLHLFVHDVASSALQRVLEGADADFLVHGVYGVPRAGEFILVGGQCFEVTNVVWADQGPALCCRSC